MNPLLFQTVIGDNAVISKLHPPVVGAASVKPNNGQYPAGLVVAEDSNALLVPWDPAGSAPVNVIVGVITEPVDTTVETEASLMVHGAVNTNKIIVGTGPIDAAGIKALQKAGIFAA
jgi:hypothetical protein